MASSITQLLTDQNDLAENIRYKCLQFEANLEILTPIDKIVGDLESALIKCKDKHDVLRSYESHASVKPYLESGLFEKTKEDVIKIREKVMDFQSRNVAEITRIKTNFHKDSNVRKTQAYLEQRLKTLEEAFAKVIDYNDALKLLPSKTDFYFVEDIFQKTKTVYEETKTAIKNLMEQETSVNQGGSGTSEQPRPSPKQLRYPSMQEERLKIQTVKMNKFVIFLDKIHTVISGGKNMASKFQRDTTQKWLELEQLDDQIRADEQPTDNLTTYIADYEATYQTYQDVSSKLEARLDQLEAPTILENTPGPAKLRIKPVEIHKFNGEYKNWCTFFETFTDAANRASLSPIEKMHHLLDSLEAEPRRVISHIQINAENYENAIKILQSRYENKRKTETAFIETILKLPTLQSRSTEGVINMHDTIQECILNLKNLGYSIEHCGPIFTVAILEKFDYETSRIFEEGLTDPKQLPTLDYVLNFLSKRHKTLEAIKANKRYNPVSSDNKKDRRQTHLTVNVNCKYCTGKHNLTECKAFKEMKVEERIKFIKSKQICRVCLEHTNDTRCNKNSRCTTCNGTHNSILHNPEHKRRKDTKTEIQEPKKSTTHHSSTNKASQQMVTCLPTAQIRVRDQLGELQTLRALIDQCSQSTFITERAAQLLKIPKHKTDIEIYGVANIKSGSVKYTVNMTVHPRFESNHVHHMEAKVLKTLTGTHPETQLVNPRSETQNLTMADPDFDLPGRIDVIIGADYYPEIIMKGVEKLPFALLQQTTLGWIASGNIKSKNKQFTTKIKTLISQTAVKELNEQLKRFWDIEDMRDLGQTTANDVELQYTNEVKRDEDGRYTVKMPLRQSAELGNSREKALARLLQTEKKLNRNTEIRKQYTKFMDEYLALNHMTEVEANQTAYFLPHHAVLKPESDTTKLRVVFDASASTTNGNSLNDIMHVGPNLLGDLMGLLIRWRLHKYVFTADIEKMFRQINIEKEQRKYQCILWRASPKEKIREYQLNTITYGTAAASFLAIRTLHQLAIDEADVHPRTAAILKSDFYMDDCLSGCQDENEACMLVKDLKILLNKGCMNLRKWSSNNPEILKHIPEADKRTTTIDFQKGVSTSKTLGIHWNAGQDEFSFKVDYKPTKITKRHVVSTVARVFDPIGWLQPTVLIGKRFMQKISSEEMKWDDEIPEELQKDWLEYANNLHLLSEIRIPRWSKHTGKTMDILGFCDASETAFAAVVYAKTLDENGLPHITLIAAKSKVAPLKAKLTIPKLELKGALLLSELVNKCLNSMQIDTTVKLFCDSKIVLAWITGSKQRDDIFVNNRIKQIRELSSKDQWFYVATKDNPADCATRGLPPSKMKTFKLWWDGPSWIQEPHEKWVNYGVHQELSSDVAQSYTITQQTQTNEEDMWYKILRRYSSFNKTIRMVAYLTRFKNNCQQKHEQRTSGAITVEEFDYARIIVIKALQKEVYYDEIKSLKAGKALNAKSHILNLTPCLDKRGLLCVGGRIQESNTSDEFKSPILMPKHTLTNVLIHDTHLETLHGQTQLVLNSLRTKYWIPKGRALVSATINKCQRCHRFKQASGNQLMGNLPKVRILPAPPFASTGIDYAGPFLTKLSTGRTTKSVKTYIAVFVCMVTKAMHLELVTGLTTDAFLAAYRRFTARRGHCKEVYTDNGTNFVGAHRALALEYKLAIQEATEHAAQLLASDGIKWHFIPPRAPHFGGLWEAAVKSVKKHLKIVLTDKLLSFEEFSTILCRVEACVNSRPLSQLTSDPNDLEALTPGHFLIGRAITAPPETSTNISLHRRWNLIKQLQDDIWERWQNEYLANLLIRGKWNVQRPNLKIGELVLAKDENLPPLKWPLARVSKLYEGEDGLVRVVDLNVGGKTKKKLVKDISKLPIENGNEADGKLPDTPGRTTTHVISKDTIQDTDRHRISPRIWLRRPASEQVKELTHAIKDQPPRKRPRMTPWQKIGVFATTMLALSFTSSTNAENNITVVYPNPGLYLEELGDIVLKRGQVRLDFAVDKNNIKKDVESANQTIQEFEAVCTETTKSTGDRHCEKWLENINKKFKHITSNVDLILDQLTTRQKRGLFGQFLQSIFGVNDEVYKSLDNLEDAQAETLKKTTHQSTLLLSTMKDLSSNTNHQITELRNKINEGFAVINEMQAWYMIIDKQKLNYHMIAVSYDTENIIDEISAKYDAILRAINQKGSILDFITFYELQDTIHKINSKLPSNIIVEHQPNKEMQITFSADDIVIHGFLNLKETSKFKLVAATAIPERSKDNKFTAAFTVTHLVAIDYNHQRYFNTTVEEVEKCVNQPQNTHLCSTTSVHNLEAHSNCMIDYIINRSDEWACEPKHFSPSSSLWKQLMLENTWLLIGSNATRIAVICGESRIEHNIKATAIIKIRSGCIIRTKDLTILSRQRSTLAVKGTYQMPMNISKYIETNEKNYYNATHLTPIIDIRGSYIPSIPDEIVAPREIIIKGHPIHHTITATTSIVLVVIIYIVWSCRSKIWNKFTKTPKLQTQP